MSITRTKELITMRLVAAALFSYVYSYAYVNVYICSGRVILPNHSLNKRGAVVNCRSNGV